MDRMSKGHTGMPSWFRATCHEASRGGRSGYSYAGRQLGRHVSHEIPYSIEDAEWDSEVEILRGHCARRNVAQINAWLLEHYPRMMDAVPRRRRGVFAAGVLDAYHETEGLPIE